MLLDHNIPAQLVPLLRGYEVSTARQIKWDHLKNGDLLKVGEQGDFDAMVTADQSIFYQQNNKRRKLALVVVTTNYRPALERHATKVADAFARSSVGSFKVVQIPTGSEALNAKNSPWLASPI